MTFIMRTHDERGIPARPWDSGQTDDRFHVDRQGISVSRRPDCTNISKTWGYAPEKTLSEAGQKSASRKFEIPITACWFPPGDGL